MKKIAIRIFLIAIVTNLLIACVNAQGEKIPVSDWWFGGGKDPSSSPFGTLFTTIGAIIGGPYGWAAGIIGTAVPAFVTHKKKNDGINGVIIATQAGRAALSPEQREVFDNKTREAMNEIVKGDPRSLIRKGKIKLKKAGKMLKERLSQKHILQDAAKIAAKELL